MAALGLHSPNCLLKYCWEHRNPEGIAALIRNGTGIDLSKREELEAHLRETKYIPVLQAVWCERDKTRQLTWLREHTGLHAVLLFELAMAEFVASPSVNTINLIVIPLMKAGQARVIQDSECVQDPLISGAQPGRQFESIYTKVLETLTREHLQKPLNEILQENKEARAAAVREKCREILERSLIEPPPSADWLKWSGVGAYLSNGISSHLSAEKVKNLRDTAARKLIEDVSSAASKVLATGSAAHAPAARSTDR